jgi:hypothetical protein
MVLMRIISEQKAARTDEAWGRASLIRALTRVLGGISFLPLLHNPVLALSATGRESC